jgi:hypothetical protein
VLALQIKDCVLDHEVDWSRDDAFFTTCRFDRAVLEEDFLVKVHREFVIVGGTLGKVEEDVVRIGSNFESCDFVGKNEHFAQCAQTSFVKGGSGGEEFEVLVGSLHQARRKRV